jgi:hypothetical protein
VGFPVINIHGYLYNLCFVMTGVFVQFALWSAILNQLNFFVYFYTSTFTSTLNLCAVFLLFADIWPDILRMSLVLILHGVFVPWDSEVKSYDTNPSTHTYHCYLTISVYHSNAFIRANMLHERNLRRRSRTSEQFSVSTYRVYSVSQITVWHIDPLTSNNSVNRRQCNSRC